MKPTDRQNVIGKLTEEITMSTRSEHPKSLGTYQVPEDREHLIKTHIAMLSETARGVSDQLAFAADISDVIGILETNGDDDSADNAPGAQ